MSRISSRPIRRGVAFAAAALLLGQAPASATWSSSTVDASFYLTEPSMQVDSADHTGIAYERYGDNPGILYATNATGSWVTARASSGSDGQPSLRFDAADKPHVAFARFASSPGIYVTDRTTGSWSAPTLVAADPDPTLPSLAIDPSGNQGVVYASNYSFAPGLYYATNSTGPWVVTKVSGGTWENTPALQFDGSGHAHILFARYAPDAPGIYYATNATGSWVTTRLTATYDDSPSFVFDDAGKIHSAFSRFASGAEATVYATNATGSWVVSQLPSGNPVSFGPPSIRLDGNGNPNIFVSVYDHSQYAYAVAGHLIHYVLSGGTWQGSSDLPLDSTSGSDDFPSLAFLSNGTSIEVAFRRTYPSAGIRFWSVYGTSVLVDGSRSPAGAPAIDLGPTNARNIAFNRREGDSGRTIFATGSGSSWTLDTAGSGNPSIFATDIGTDTNGKVRILDGEAFYSNATSAWTSDTTLPFGGQGEVAVDGTGHAHIVYGHHEPPYWLIDYATDATGAWVSDSPFVCCVFEDDVEPTIALDGNGKPHIAWLFASSPGDTPLVYQNRVSGAWSGQVTILGSPNAWPSIAVDGAGKAHIAVLHYGSKPGVYYLTNKTGAWVSTRLTHSWSDGAPSIALDGSGHAYIATTRASWAADPGVYVMTNASGSWVKAQVVSGFDLGDVSISVTSGGLARMVFASSAGILEYENSVATLTSIGPAPLSSLRVLAAASEGPSLSASAAPGYGPPAPEMSGTAGDTSRTKTIPANQH